jgi:hypothetical protein
VFERLLHSIDHSAIGQGSSPAVMESASPMPLGRRAFIAGTAGAVAATAMASTAEAAVPAGASYYQAVNPVRLADTRTFLPYTSIAKNFRRLNDRTIRIDIRNSPYVTDSADVAAVRDAVAVVVSIAAVYNGARGWVKATPAGNSNLVSNINMENGDGAVANLATVKVGSGGQIDISGQHAYQVVVDIVGVYRATSTAVRAGRMQFLPETQRALTLTRMGSRTWRTVKLSQVPRSAQAVAINLTVDQCRTDGFLTALAQRTSGQPSVSNLNHAAAETRAAGAIVRLGQTDGIPSIELYSKGDANVIVDVTGYITGSAAVSDDDGLFVPIEPTRVMDTRRAADFSRSGKKRLWPGWTRSFELPNNTGGFGQRSQMKGVVMNATLVTALNLGFVTVLPAQTARREVSNLNAARVGHIVANHVISQVSVNGVEMFAHCGGDVIADVAGWYVGPPKPTTLSNPAFDPAPPTAPFNWVLSVPRMGVQNWVIPNTVSGDPVVDSGNTWHWTHTGLIGAAGASIVVFGHRTSKGGPYRKQHELVSNDRLYVYTPDSRRYEYRFVGEKLTGSSGFSILNAAHSNSAGTTFTLVACTGPKFGPPDDQPRGEVTYRIVSTFVLVGWTDERPNEG